MLNFLIVDDNFSDRTFLRKLSEQFPAKNLSISEADSAEAGLQLCREKNIDLILLDFNLPDGNGISFLNKLKNIEAEVIPAVVIVTGEINPAIDELCLNNGAVNFLTKGNISQESFLRASRYALKGKERELELNRLRKQYEDASNSKDRFLAYLSHEFRTPLTSIISTGELMSNPSLMKNPNHEELGQTIKENGMQILNLIDDLIKLSSLNERRHFLDYENISLIELQSIIKEKFQKLHGDSINFRVELHGQLPDYFSCDYYCLKQILRFIIDNAFRNTFSGGILVSIAIPSQELLQDLKLNTDEDYINFTVQDTGPGYGKKTLSALKSAIAREQIPSIDNFNGNGISLLLAATLCHELNGEISIESEVGKGTKINFTVPSNSPEKNKNILCPKSHKSEKVMKPELKNILEKQAKPIVEQIAHSLCINELNDFLCKMKSLTIEHKNKDFYEWCESLEQHLNEYDIDKIQKHLKSFDQLFSSK